MLYKNNRIKLTVKFLKSMTETGSSDKTYLVESLPEKMNDKKFIIKFNKKRAEDFFAISAGLISTIDGFLTYDKEHGVHIRMESMNYTKFHFNKLELTGEFLGLEELSGGRAELVKFKGVNSSLDTELFSLLYFLNSKSLSHLREVQKGSLVNFQCFIMADHKRFQGRIVKTSSALLNTFTVIKESTVAVN